MVFVDGAGVVVVDLVFDPVARGNRFAARPEMEAHRCRLLLLLLFIVMPVVSMVSTAVDQSQLGVLSPKFAIVSAHLGECHCLRLGRIAN